VSLANLAAAQKITVQSSGAGFKGTFQNGRMDLMALQDTPTTAAHWEIGNVSGGASPYFSAYLDTQQNLATTDETVVQYDEESSDNNSNYDKTTNFRFQPTVPGMYFIGAEFLISGSDAGNFFIVIKEGGSLDLAQAGDYTAIAGNRRLKTSAQIFLNGTTDYVDVRTDSVSDSAYSIVNALQSSSFMGHRIGN